MAQEPNISMSDDISFEATAVVRSYSFEVEQRLGQGLAARHLSQALVEERNSGHLEDVTSPWRSFFEANDSDPSSGQAASPLRFFVNEQLTRHKKCDNEHR